MLPVVGGAPGRDPGQPALVFRFFFRVVQVRGAFDRHVKVTRVLFPVWLYVSITGVIVYVVLYRVPV